MKNLIIILVMSVGFNFSVFAQMNCQWSKTNGEAGISKSFSSKTEMPDGIQLNQDVGSYQLTAVIYSDSNLSPELRIFYRSDLIGISYGKHLGVRMIEDTTKYFEISCTEE